jgi:hypothetical protein
VKHPCSFEIAKPQRIFLGLLRAGSGTPGNIRRIIIYEIRLRNLPDSIAREKTSPSAKSYILSSGAVIDRRHAVDGCEPAYPKPAMIAAWF